MRFRSPSPSRATRALLLAASLLALPSAAHSQKWMRRLRDVRLEAVVYGRVQQSRADTDVDRMLQRAGFADSVFAAYYDSCGLFCGGMGGPSGFKWFDYPQHERTSGWSTPVFTLSAAVRTHLRATAIYANAASLGEVIGGACPNLTCYTDGPYGPYYLIGLNSRVSTFAVVAEGEFGPLRIGIGPATNGVTVQSLRSVEQERPWKEQFRPFGGVGTVGLTLPLWRRSVVSARWVYSAMGDVSLSSRDVLSATAPGIRPPLRFGGGKVNLSNSFVVVGLGLQLR